MRWSDLNGKKYHTKHTQAIQFAAAAHEGQNRKCTAIPFIVHPVDVAGLVAEFCGSEDQQIAAMLQDVLEDGGPHYAPQIKVLFGSTVLSIVEASADGVPDAAGVKPPWTDRKHAYIKHLTEASDEMLLVSGCDKLSNAQAILADLHKIGWSVFDRFTAKRDGTIWYYS
jgi:(p)ppGpp synthase/HD superfamily hydrolase